MREYDRERLPDEPTLRDYGHVGACGRECGKNIAAPTQSRRFKALIRDIDKFATRVAHLLGLGEFSAGEMGNFQAALTKVPS
jgi:hypothetical protein